MLRSRAVPALRPLDESSLQHKIACEACDWDSWPEQLGASDQLSQPDRYD